MELYSEEMKTKSLEDEFKIKSLTVEKNRLESEIHLFKYLEKENTELRGLVKTLHTQLEKMASLQPRSKTPTLEKEKQTKLIEMTGETASAENLWDALEESGLFKDIFSTTPKSMLNVDIFVEQVKILKIQNDRLKQERNEKDAEILRKDDIVRELQRRVLTEQEKVRVLEEDISESKHQTADADVLYTELDVMSAELSRINEKYKNCKNEMEKWRSRALALKHVDRDLTPRKMSKLLEAKEEIIESARNAANNVRESSAEEDSREKSSLSVLQALSMWNTNFSNPPQTAPKDDTIMEEEIFPDYLTPKRLIATSKEFTKEKPLVYRVRGPNQDSQHSLLAINQAKKKPLKSSQTLDEIRGRADKSMSVLSKTRKKGSLPSHLMSMYKSYTNSNDDKTKGTRFIIP